MLTDYHPRMLKVFVNIITQRGFPDGSVVKNLPMMQESKADPWVGKIPWRKE